ncbi:TAXI family TRAP transporter solute-binding subunit [Yinghuangia soli]|uniref:TAXI family TRAP transporter solute-binding subunit n=1 Tax=Yinghuangia soli TaxID=2908204 RepID=A0AA41U4L7_9ACTN|nr:TAXI family TRAP transporter solute-binding subunit [Yinghuangia soli]MCF2533071.1 TAXI family TRAP transporter solute-binding subunit [Yinghuangia soli]
MRQGGTAPVPRGGGQIRRTRTIVALALALALALFAGGLWISSDDAAPYRGGPISIAAGVRSGVYFKYGELLAPRLTEDLGAPVRVDESSGSVDNLARIGDGRNTLGIATADSVANLDPAKRAELRAVARLYDDYVQLVVPASSGIRSLEDLKGKRVVIGPPQSGVELITRRILATAEMDADRDIVPVRLGIGDATKELGAGNVDAFFWSGGLPTEAVWQLARSMKLRFVPLGEVATKLRAKYGHVYREAVIPADAYPGLDGRRDATVPTIAVPNLLVTRADADTGLIRQVTGTVMGERESIGAQVHAAQLVDPRTAIFTDPPLKLHEGARLWYRSAKP